MANHGVTFDQQLITAANMAHFFYDFSEKKSGISKGCTMTTSGMNINVSAGYFYVCGRMVEITGIETITVDSVTSGTAYCYLVYEVDLSKVNTSEDFQQGAFRVLTDYSTYPTLVQQNLDDNPTDGVYQFPFAAFTVTTSGISNFADVRKQFDKWLTGTLTAGQTTLVISDPSVTANSTFQIFVDNSSAFVVNRTATNGTLTITFKALSTNVNVKVRVF